MTHAELHNYKAAREDLQAAKEADPSAAGEIDREMGRLKAKEAAATARQRKEMRNFLARK